MFKKRHQHSFPNKGNTKSKNELQVSMYLLNWLVTCFWEKRFSAFTVLLKCFSRIDRMMASSSGFLTRPASSMYPNEADNFFYDFKGTQVFVSNFTEISDTPHHHPPNAAASPERRPSAPPACSGLPSGTDLWVWWSRASPQTQKIPGVRTEGEKLISKQVCNMQNIIWPRMTYSCISIKHRISETGPIITALCRLDWRYNNNNIQECAATWRSCMTLTSLVQ